MTAILVGAGILFFFHTGLIALFPLTAANVLAWVNFLVQKRISPRLKEIRDLHGGVFQLLVENIDGIRTLRSHAAQGFMRERFAKKLTLLTKQSLHVVRTIGVLLGSNEFFAQGLVVLSLSLVALAFSRGALTVEDALLYPFYLSLFFNAAQDLSKSAYDWNRFLVEGSRLGAFLEISPTRLISNTIPSSGSTRFFWIRSTPFILPAAMSTRTAR